jgi:hypothetical protein
MTNQKWGSLGKACAISAVMVGAVLLAGAVGTRAAQDPEEGTPLSLKVGRQIQATDFNTQTLTMHVMPANTAKGKEGRELQKKTVPANKNSQGWGGNGVSYYPGDLSYQGGNVVETAVSHAVYVNCNASCFGYPTKFLRNLQKSQLIHVTDQYVGSNAYNRYSVGQSGIIEYTVNGPVGPSDIETLVHASAEAFGSGYGQIHHIFFAPGIDICDDAALTVATRRIIWPHGISAPSTEASITPMWDTCSLPFSRIRTSTDARSASPVRMGRS